jgi:hypothetical protein
LAIKLVGNVVVLGTDPRAVEARDVQRGIIQELNGLSSFGQKIRPRVESAPVYRRIIAAAGHDPKSIWQVLTRHKEIQYASRAISHIARQKQIHQLRLAAMVDMINPIWC